MVSVRHPRPLEIAIISTTAVATPPKAYGGTELVVAELARGLVELGHRPTVFATGDSECAGVLRPSLPQPVWPPDPLVEVRHAGYAWKEIAGGHFDVVHVNHAAQLPFACFVSLPTVATVHHDREESLASHYASYPDVAFVAISTRQRQLSPDVPFQGVIHHGLSPSRYPLGTGEGGYCAFLGRFAPEKGPHLAIEAARAAGVPIRLAGNAHPVARQYFERDVHPRMALPDVTWVGEVGGEDKTRFLEGALCLLFPIQWEEPFGLVMIEAMLVGTPVLAFGRGSVPEVIDEGVTGFIVRDVDEMAARIRTIASLDRKRCRDRARERWSAERMAREHVAFYERVMHER